MNKKLQVFLFFVLLFIAFLLRSWMFLHGDFYFLPDQGRDMQLAKIIAVDHKMTLIGGHAGIGGLFHGPLWWYMIVPFFLLSHGNPFYSLVPLYEIISLGIIISGFFIGKKLYGDFVGFLIALLTTFSNEFISTISFTSNSQVMPLIFLFYLFTIILFLRGKDKAIILSLLCIGLGMHFEAAFAVFLFPLTIFAFIYRRHMPSLKILLSGLCIFILSILNFILFDIRHQFLMTHTVLNLFSGHIKPDKANAAYANFFFRVGDRISWFFMTLKSTLYTENTLLIFLVMLIFTSAIILIMYVYMHGRAVENRKIEKEKNKTQKGIYNDRLSQLDKEIIFLFAFIFFSYLLYIFYPLPLQEHYVQSLMLGAIVLLALCMQKIASRKIGIGIIGLFLIINCVPGIQKIVELYSSHVPYASSSEGTYKNQLHAVDYVFTDAHRKPFGYFVYDAPIVTYGMDYLIWWQGNTTYHYIPESKKFPITYLIMLPAPAGDIHAHDFWKKYVVRTNGKIVSDKVLTGNIEVQKLTVDPNEGSADPNYYQYLIFR